jgi:hypothetical protein
MYSVFRSQVTNAARYIVILSPSLGCTRDRTSLLGSDGASKHRSLRKIH